MPMIGSCYLEYWIMGSNNHRRQGKQQERIWLFLCIYEVILSPAVIGMDIIDNKNLFRRMSRLIFTLTQKTAGGALWLDLVDKEVQISDAIMKNLLERYLDRDIYERFFISERARRTL